MTIVTSTLPEKSDPFFPSKFSLKFGVLSGPLFLKMLLEPEPPPPPSTPYRKRGECTLWAFQICTVIMFNNSNISKKIYLAKHFVQKSGNSKYYSVLNSKLHYGYLFAYFTKYSGHNCLLNHLQEHILSCQ